MWLSEWQPDLLCTVLAFKHCAINSNDVITEKQFTFNHKLYGSRFLLMSLLSASIALPRVKNLPNLRICNFELEENWVKNERRKSEKKKKKNAEVRNILFTFWKHPQNEKFHLSSCYLEQQSNFTGKERVEE